MANDKNFKVKNGLDVGDKTTITSSGTIGLSTIANGYLQITNGTNTLAFDPNEIYGDLDLNIGTASGDIDLRPSTGVIKVYDGASEATISYTKIGQWDSAYNAVTNYLPLSGGTLTGNLGLETALNPKLRLKTTDNTITTGQVISTVEFIGAIGVGSTTAGHIQQVATEDWAAGAVGSDMVFSINTGSSFDERLRLTSDGVSISGDLFVASGNIGGVGSPGYDVYISSGTGTNGNGLRCTNYISTNAVLPCRGDGSGTDNVTDLGTSGTRFDDVYATNGTIQTSDRNEKQDIEELSDAETRVAVACKGLLRKFRWKDSVDEKGEEARTHFGIIAQDLQDAFSSEGLDAGDYAMFISTTWTDEETNEEKTRLGVRYSELLAFIIAAL